MTPLEQAAKDLVDEVYGRDRTRVVAALAREFVRVVAPATTTGVNTMAVAVEVDIVDKGHAGAPPGWEPGDGYKKTPG